MIPSGINILGQFYSLSWAGLRCSSALVMIVLLLYWTGVQLKTMASAEAVVIARPTNRGSRHGVLLEGSTLPCRVGFESHAPTNAGLVKRYNS